MDQERSIQTSLEAICQNLSTKAIAFKTSRDGDWRQYSEPLNLRCPVEPAIVVVPSTVEHVRDAILSAAKWGLKVQAKSGGHSYASYSNGGISGNMVVDMRNFRDVRLADDGIAVVGSGARLGELSQYIYHHGKRALSHGTCLAVGVGGHFSHGGFGFSSRAWGLAMDHIVGLDLVTASGDYVHASKTQNTGLFYAMRGAADSFGIVMTFHLRTQPAPDTVVVWKIDLKDIALSGIEEATKAFEQIQEFGNSNPAVDRNLGFGLRLGPGYFHIDGLYMGPIETFHSRIVPAIVGDFLTKSVVSAQQVDWLESLELFDEGGLCRNFYAKSVTVPSPGMPTAAIRSYISYILSEGTKTHIPFSVLVNLYGGRDGRINTEDEFSAYPHRDTMWTAQHLTFAPTKDKKGDEDKKGDQVEEDKRIDGEGSDNDNNQKDGYWDKEVGDKGMIEFTRGLNETMTRDLSRHGAYSGYVDPVLTREEAHRLYFGEAITRRLEHLKGKLDPGNVFANPQSIEPKTKIVVKGLCAAEGET